MTGRTYPGTGRRSAPARRVRDILRARIRSGVYGNLPLPSESQLAADFDTSRNIVRDALTLLRDEGLVDRVPGAGTFVVADKAVQGLDRLRGLAETFETGSDRVVNTVLLAEVVPATPIVAERLELEPGTPVVALERVRHLDGAPLSLDASYLTADVGAPLLQCDLTGCDVFGLLEAELGLPLGSAAVSIEAVAADATVAGLLAVRPGSPLLFLERLTYTDSGRPIDLEYVRYRGDRFSLSGRLHRIPVTPNRGAAELKERG
ncbi:GntR family transcriptional regulator [Nocardia amikacinitolerans]|uniref:GntR family transcriptional regulator n=1 Tax=Nocardia amikacinitolerans TaxID=756689 RepID=A0A285LWH4_9NOCA|nr:GntR family transcriptional regulator [Nocardia amikacinitolerans]MCP2316703.1 GntR family transcriptional regulator [Nocardia amikacinitolerans]SNY88803.1 GntR family transcriptional regulator [Nocardia amikacinitolerans]